MRLRLTAARFSGSCALLALALAACSSGPQSSTPPVLPALNGADSQFEAPPAAVLRDARAANAGGFLAAPADELTSPAHIPIRGPVGLAVDSARNLYIANHANGGSQILIYSAAGQQLTSRTITEKLGNPSGIFVAKNGFVYEADRANKTVQEYDTEGKFVRAIRVASSTSPFTPSEVTISPSTGDIWVALRDDNDIAVGRLDIFSPAGTLLRTTMQGLVYPLGIAFSPTTGLAWVGNSETPQGNSFSVFDADLKLRATYRVDITPGYLAFDKAGDFWASAPFGTSVHHFTQQGRDLGGPLTKYVEFPYGVAIDSEGYVYVAPVSENYIVKFDSKGHYVNALK